MQIPGLQFMTLLLCSLTIRISVASGLYFSQSNLTLRFPYLIRHDTKALSEITLINLRTLRNDSTAPKDVEYQIFMLQEKFATYQKNMSRIVLRNLPQNESTIIVKASEKGSSAALLKMKVQPIRVMGENINCTDYLQDICFWNTSNYRIYENQPITMIGTFGPEAYSYVCPEFSVIRYELSNGSDYFHIVDGKLFTNASLDRDIIGPPGGPGPRVQIGVKCLIWEKTGGHHVQLNVLTINILDQDDNPPIAQGKTSIAITLPDLTEGHKMIDDNLVIFKDADAVTSNKYSVRLIGDISNALNITYDTLSIEHNQYFNKAPYTAIFPKIHARKTLLTESPYHVVLQITDESLLEGYGANSVNISLIFSGPVHRASTIATPSSIATKSFSYPPSVKIARISPRFMRVAKPTTKPHPSITFILNGSDAFYVTRRDGIVYVSNETKLRSEPDTVQLQLKWSGDDRIATRILRVNLVNVSSEINTCELVQKEMHSCANAESREACEKSCGIASGVFSNDSFVGRCVWRGSRTNDSSHISEYYSTCSPDLTYCPDNECDELERNEPRICPQDCTVESDIHFGAVNKDGRGIKRAPGTCVCTDELKCICGIDAFRQPGNNVPDAKEERLRKSRDRKNEILVSRKASSGSCDPTCMISIIGATLFVLIVVIVSSFIIWRYRMAVKGARRECKHTVDDAANDTGILPSDYIDHDDGLLIGQDTFTVTNRHLLLPKTCPPDPKWEFPRSLLKIEQVLGEGEFGRVLRAKAMNISEMPGPTIVAVKTLKEDACASELADLLSEYQLLKEAQHPNVIRLLGACTTPPGEPVYLIIEFAEFGFLRNYLRRSRHLESENRTCGSTSLLSSINAVEESRCIENDASNCIITPRDILSFAWQISKGMAYLVDIKLVHRDLAARNVLLATGKVCKISHFGLTRDVYEDDAYLKRSKGRVSVKWMAPESLADHVYNSKSNVWSFGVLLWELVTLGSSPYPGVDVHNLYNLLKAGYRMEKPPNCSHQLYKLMASCWHQEPSMRPSFKELTSHCERMLEDVVEYLDLNPKTVQAYFASLQTLDSASGSDNDQMNNGTGTILKTNTVNYLDRMPSETVTKCDEVDKLQALWHPSVASFPEEAMKSSYVNDRPASINHYESPIKLRNISMTSKSENDLTIPSNERPQSYSDREMD